MEKEGEEKGGGREGRKVPEEKKEKSQTCHRVSSFYFSVKICCARMLHVQ